MNQQEIIPWWRLFVLNKLKVGVVGCGKIFPMHVYSLLERDDVEVVSLADTNEDRV